MIEPNQEIVSKYLISLHIGDDEYRIVQKTGQYIEWFFIYKNDEIYHLVSDLFKAAQFLVEKWEEVNG